MNVIELTNRACGAKLASVVKTAIAENNSVLAGCNVHWIFRGSVVDLETGRHGIRWLIARILMENGNTGMVADDICTKVRQANGFDKYPDDTILNNLGVIMLRSGQVRFVQQTNDEDWDRNSNANQAARVAKGLDPIAKRPRRKWYLVTE